MMSYRDSDGYGHGHGYARKRPHEEQREREASSAASRRSTYGHRDREHGRSSRDHHREHDRDSRRKPYDNRQSRSRHYEDRSRPRQARVEDVEEGELPYEEEPPQKQSQQEQQQEEPSVDLDAQLDAPQEAEPDPEAVLAEKRRRRAEIMAKYAQQQQQPSTGGPAAPSASADTPPVKRIKLDDPTPAAAASTREGTATPEGEQQLEEGEFDLTKGEAAPGDHPQQQQQDDEQGHGQQQQVSAAEYNPDQDRKEDALRQLMHNRVPQSDQPHAHAQADAAASKQPAQDEETEEIEVEVPEEEDEHEHQSVQAGGHQQQNSQDDEDDEDDMFAAALNPKASTSAQDQKPKKKKVIRVKKGHGAAEKLQATGMVVIDRRAEASIDEADDSEGYYRVILGEMLDAGRYHVHANLGKGMFSSVVRAKDMQNGGKEVAIKIIRSQETMYKAGQKEAGILNKLAQADPQDKKHMIRMLRTFDHRNHLCLVFESMALNLREVVKRYGKDVGINLKAVRAYAHQMFLGLALMKKCNLMHADLKPDNVLVNENHSQLKISDLGSASDTSENDITPYLVSRFYRAPEIILGLPYDCALDMWSIGCTLYELYTGKILFPGRNNNQMLLHIQELKGRFNNRNLKKAKFAEQHFDELGNFVTTEVNKQSGTEAVVKMSLPTKPTSDLKSRLAPQAQLKRMPPDEARMLSNFVDLLDKTLDLDPAKRILPKDALSHPFMR